MTRAASIAAERLALAAPLVGAGVALAIADPKGDPLQPFPEESACLSSRAVARRRSEFSAGRAAARNAMVKLGIEPRPVLAGDDRAPIWPRGLVGSISHTYNCAMAAVARRGDVESIGIDAEEGTPLEEQLFSAICSVNEQAWLSTQDEPALLAKLVFSAKEAAYKCQYPLSGRLFGFDGMELEIDRDAGVFKAVFTADQPPFNRGDAIRGRFAIGSGLIVTAAELRAREVP